MRPLSPTELAYIAGILDGEGCITILRKPPRKGVGVSPSHTAHVVVTSTTMELLEWCKERCGGFIATQRTWAIWALSGARAANLLRACKPYLVGKGEQADVVIALQEEVEACRPQSDPTTIERREALHQKIKSMHQTKGFAARFP